MQITHSPRRSPNLLDAFTRQAASTLITTYQKQLSPRKGFSCAYRVLHRSESCSQYTKQTILELGFAQALPLIRQRFQACKAANQTLKAQGCRSIRSVPSTIALQTAITPVEHRSWLAMDEEPLADEPLDPPDDDAETGEKPPGQRRTGGGSFRKAPTVSDSGATDGSGANSNCSDWNCDAIDCASLGCDAIDCSSSDWSAAHCSGADCSGLDCGSCDVGSCDCSS